MQRLKAPGRGQRPVVLEDLVLALQALEQAARLHAQYQIGQQADLGVVQPAHDVVGRDLVGMPETGGLHQLLQRMQGIAMKVGHACGLVGHDQRLLAHGILRGDARGTGAGVAALGLDAADGNAPQRATSRLYGIVGSHLK